MNILIDEFLGLLCNTCGASSAHLRIFASVDDNRVKITAHRRSVYRNVESCKTGHIIPMPFLFQEAPVEQGRSTGFDPAESAPNRLFKTDIRFESSICSEGWRLNEIGDNNWCFSNSVHGLYTELHVYFEKMLDGFVCRSLGTVSSFLQLLESIIPVTGTVPECAEECITDHIGGRSDSSSRIFDPPLFGTSPEILLLKKQIAKVAVSGIPVLIEGENGTGKEIVARNIHTLRLDNSTPMIIVNCMEMPPSLLQSELFGHVKGSFTGALCDRRGLIESAAGGTFFLDEIGEMPLRLQTALLRVIQEKEIRRVGESSRRAVDVRFVFATNRNLVKLVREGKFREDLYYRIKGVRLYVPPLRKRKEDIILLATLFLKSAVRALDRRMPVITVGAARNFLSYNWPGNVRELKNEIERILTLYPGVSFIQSEMLSSAIREGLVDMPSGLDCEADTLPSAMHRLETRMIKETLRRFSGNRTKSAEALGITRQGLLKKMKRHNIIEPVR